MFKGYEIKPVRGDGKPGSIDMKGWGSLARKFFCVPIIALGLILAGCAGGKEARATSALAIACDSFATVLDQLTPLREAGEISVKNIERVDATLRVVSPVCATGSSVDPAKVIGIVDRGVDMLKIVYSTIGG